MRKVELGKPYRFIFAQPGNDTTIVIIIGNTDTQWICWDIYFKMEVIIEKSKDCLFNYSRGFDKTEKQELDKAYEMLIKKGAKNA